MEIAGEFKIWCYRVRSRWWKGPVWNKPHDQFGGLVRSVFRLRLIFRLIFFVLVKRIGLVCCGRSWPAPSFFHKIFAGSLDMLPSRSTIR
jgi:hypothetical protein